MPGQKNQDSVDRQLEPTMQSDCFLSNKINHHETSGESFNLSELQYLHRLPYLFKEGSCLDLGFPKLYLAKLLGVGWGKFPCYLCLENLAFSMHHLGESRHTWKGQFFFFEHPVSIHPISSNFLWYLFGNSPFFSLSPCRFSGVDFHPPLLPSTKHDT